MKAIIIFSLLLFSIYGNAQETTTIVAPTSEAADGLDLHAVSELFKDAENLEAFEKALNDPETGINNLDLDENDEVDYIRVVEDVVDETHVIILQAQLAEDEYQDVATIEVEKTGDEDYNMQIHGNDDIYGYDYYVEPTVVHVHTWPIITWIYRPYYRPYRSAFYFGVYPHWWHPWRPVTVSVYRTRTVRYTTRSTFRVTNTSRVTTVHKVNYQPRSSTRVTKTTRRTVKTDGGTKTVGTKKTVRKNADGTTTTTRKAGKKVTDPETGKTKSVGVSSKKTRNPRTGQTTTVRKKGKKVENPEKGVKKSTKKTTRKKTVKKQNRGNKKGGGTSKGSRRRPKR